MNNNIINNKPDIPIISFETQKEWHAWLDKHQDKTDGVWVRFYKKASGVPTVTYAEALDEALCYGWIDGQAKRYDEKSYLQKFTPRRARSVWSKINTGHVERLTKLGLMKPAGLKAVEAAKLDGRWARAYESSKDMKVPEDFLKELKKHTGAYEFFQALNKSNTFAIAFNVASAKKQETRERRIKKYIEMLEKGEKIY